MADEGQFDYQSVCHCSKTQVGGGGVLGGFDYQSVCHCSKTGQALVFH